MSPQDFSRIGVLNLNDKVAVITGASSGIGAETAELFSKLGCDGLILCGRNEERLKEARQKCLSVGQLPANRVAYVSGDLKRDLVRQEIIKTSLELFKRIDILVNCAGIVLRGSSNAGLNLDDYDAIMDINVRSIVALCQLYVPYLKQTKGNIVNVSSSFGERPTKNHTFFCMSKAALDMYTKCMALELGTFGIRVNSVNPSVVEGTLAEQRKGSKASDLTQFYNYCANQHPIGRCCEADDVARAIAYLASDLSAFTTGQLLNVDGGLGI